MVHGNPKEVTARGICSQSRLGQPAELWRPPIPPGTADRTASSIHSCSLQAPKVGLIPLSAYSCICSSLYGAGSGDGW